MKWGRISPKVLRNASICFICLLVLWIWEGDNYFQTNIQETHTGIFHSAGTILDQDPSLVPKFSPYVGGDTKQLSPSWILTAPNESSVHRFFDSSPFSPSGKYVAVTEMGVRESRAVKFGDRANIVVMDLEQGTRKVVATTTAWDSQVGAHVQWGTSDEELYFNTIQNITKDSWVPKGVVLNMFTEVRRVLDCPVYQVSPDGRYSAAPDLTMIKYTQLGYGVFVPHTHASVNASKYNGLFLADLTANGKCRLLVSLYDIAKFAKIPADVPMYGFHTKWSSDGAMIMFVVRTLTPAAPQDIASKILPSRPKMARINHMFAVSVTGQILAHVVSWGSSCALLPSRQYGGRITHVVGDIAVRGDGNHPNWIPGSHNISVNYRQTCDYPSSSSAGSVPVWKIAVFNVDDIVRQAPQGLLTDSFKVTSKMTNQVSQVLSRGYISYPFGTGHPNYLPGGRYAVVDAYLKEQRMFGSSLVSTAGHEGLLPLRLVDLHTQREVWLLQVNLKRFIIHGNKAEQEYVLGKQSLRWRCDMHPAFSRDYKWIAINARPGKHLRQVMVVYLGDDLSKYFGQ